MHFNRPSGAGEQTINVVTIAWKTEEKKVQNGNTTTTETVVTDVRRQSTEVRLTDSFSTATVELPDTEEQQFVTMYVKEYPGARWVFPHDPIALADSLPFGGSWGSYLSWFVTRFLAVTAIGVPAAIGGAYKTLDYTYTGPGKGVIWWLIAGGLLSYLALYFAHGTMAVLLTSAPWIMGIFVDIIAYIATLELADPTDEARFESVVTTDAQNPLGEDLPDISEEWAEHLHFVERPDGIALVKPSLTYFVTLLAGAEPPTLSLTDLKTRVKSRGSSPEEEKFYGREPEGDDDDLDAELVYIQWPALQFGPDGLREQVDQVGLPNGDQDVDDAETRTVTTSRWDRDRLIRAGLFGLAVGAVGNIVLGGLGYAALGVAVGAFASTVRRVDGSASFDPAPAHSTAAKARAVTEQHELAIADTFEQLQEKVAEADATTTEQAVDIAEAYIGQLRGQIDRLIGGDDSGGLPGAGDQGPADPTTNGRSRETGVSDD